MKSTADKLTNLEIVFTIQSFAHASSVQETNLSPFHHQLDRTGWKRETETPQPCKTITAAFANMQPPAPQVVQLQAPPPVVAAPHVPVWTRTPALTRETVLDYQNVPGDAKIFKDNMVKLDTIFSLAKPNVTALITELGIRAVTSSWKQLMRMTINAVNLNFLKSYGRVTLPELRTHVETFIDLEGRLSQNDYQLYVCLTWSVDVATKETMESEHDLYHAGQLTPVGAAEPERHPSGLLYAKVLLTKAQADSQATITHARSNLIALDQYMANLPDSDVKLFNEYVWRQLQTLTARGETTQDLVLHLFRGYMMVRCPVSTTSRERRRDIRPMESSIPLSPSCSWLRTITRS
jgi:hypothetical protein